MIALGLMPAPSTEGRRAFVAGQYITNIDLALVWIHLRITFRFYGFTSLRTFRLSLTIRPSVFFRVVVLFLTSRFMF